jgi:hypothetical protein
MNYGVQMLWRHIWRDPQQIGAILYLVEHKGFTVPQAFIHCYQYGIYGYGYYHIGIFAPLITNPEALKTVFDNPLNQAYYDDYVITLMRSSQSKQENRQGVYHSWYNNMLHSIYGNRQETYSTVRRLFSGCPQHGKPDIYAKITGRTTSQFLTKAAWDDLVVNQIKREERLKAHNAHVEAWIPLLKDQNNWFIEKLTPLMEKMYPS